MKKITYSEAANSLRTYGRVWHDTGSNVLYMDYTCCGIRLRFTGCLLAVDFRSIPDTLVPPGTDVPPKREDWPYIGVFLDGAEVPCRKIQVRDGDTLVVFLSETPETHEILIVKLTENFRTCLGVAGFLMDGVLQTLPEEAQRDIIEFIGDSITCGFGNDTADPTHEFSAAEEDGWLTHGAIAARTLNLEPRFICVSGIAVAGMPLPGGYSMCQLYPYTDRIIQEKLGFGEEQLERYNFEAKPARYIVLNLGTNDSSQIYFSPDKNKAVREFRENYAEFVKSIRMLNGPNAVIICALGCMDYYLFDEIQDIVEELRKTTGDLRLFTLKYNKMMTIGPDVGGCYHPSIFRQQLMAEDLVRRLRSLQESGL